MPWWRRFMERLTGRADRDLDRELRAHLELEAEEHQDAGLPPQEARNAAQRAFGNTTLIAEDTRAMWGWTSIERSIQDFRYGLRMLLKSRTFTLVAIMALALGIGANTAIFSVINTVLLRPLPYRDADRIVELWQTHRGSGEMSVAYPDFLDWRKQTDLFEDFATAITSEGTLTGAGRPAERIRVAYVSDSYFDVFGIRPALGRGFLSREDQKGGSPVAVLSHEFWQRRFAGDPAILGRTVNVDNRSLTAIGILPPRALSEYRNGDVYAPIELAASQLFLLRGNHNGNVVVGRPRRGVTLDQIRAQISAISKRLERQYRENAEVGAGAGLLRERLGRSARPLLSLLLAAVAGVLLIACVNVANLLLARASTRRRELTIRAALGASRLRLVRQLLTESILLALAGGLLGMLLARWSFDALIRLVPDASSMGGLALDWRVLAFTLGLSVLTGMLFGLAPALQAARRNLSEAMRETGRTSAGAESRRLRGALVVVEIGLAFVLLAGAGLLLRSFGHLLRVDPGFQRERVMTMRLGLPDGAGVLPAQSGILCRRVLERVENLPGVVHSGIGTALGLSGFSSTTTIHPEGTPDPGRGKYPGMRVRAVTPGYFAVMGIPLLRGRFVTERDGSMPMVSREQLVTWFKQSSLPVVINQTAARRFWPNEDPVGRRLRQAPDWSGPWLTVVGVVGDVKDDDLAQAPGPTMYFSAYLYPMADTLVLRTAGDPAAIVPAVRREVQAVDPTVPITHIRTIREIVSGSVAGRRTNMLMLGVLAGLAFLLAMVGVYGVMAYTVAQRTQEIGVRLALGATGRDVLAMVLRNGGGLVLAGIGVGAVAAAALTRFIAGMLYGVGATDPLTFAAAGGTLAAVALLASYIPARRATRVDPIQALRYE